MTAPEESSPPLRVDEVFSYVHRQAHEVAYDVPVFDSSRDQPEAGEIYSHQKLWQHPYYGMPASTTCVRIATEQVAPYLLEVWSLHPGDQPSLALPYIVQTFGHIGGNAIEMQRENPSAPIGVKLGPIYKDGIEQQSAEQALYADHSIVDRLDPTDQERLGIAVKSVQGIVEAIRYLLSIDVAERNQALANLRLPKLYMHYPVPGDKVIDPRLVDIQLELAKNHPKYATRFLRLPLLDLRSQLTLALSGGILKGRVNAELAEEFLAPTRPPLSKSVLSTLVKSFLDASGFGSRNS